MDVVGLDERAGARVASLVAAVPDGAWSAPTPCEGWTVRDLVTHLVAGNVKYTGIANGDDYSPGAPDVVLGDDPADTYGATLAEMVAAWRQPGALEREVGLPRGARGRAEVAAWIHLTETLGHGWDLATATGQPPAFDDDVVRACLDDCRRRMPPTRGEGSPFADAVAVAHDPRDPSPAPIDELAAFLGRRTSSGV